MNRDLSNELASPPCSPAAGPDAGCSRRAWAEIGGGTESGGGRLGLVLGALLIFALILVAYRPILPGSFLMDDRRLIEGENPLATGELGPWSVWFQTDFALSTFVLWAQWLAWGGKSGLVSRGQHGASRPERRVVVAAAGAAENPRRMAGRGDFCGASGGRRFRGANRRVEEHAFAALLSAGRLVLHAL